AVLNELRALHGRTKPQAWILHNVLPVVSLGVYRLGRELGVPIIQWLHNYRPLSLGGMLRTAQKELQPEDPWLSAKEIVAGTWGSRALTGWLAIGYALLRLRKDFSAVQAWITVCVHMKQIFRRGGWTGDRVYVFLHFWVCVNPVL